MTINRLAIIQARMSSSRLPGKVLMDISGKPMLQRVIERTMQAKYINQVVLATSSDTSDDILLKFCQKHGFPCFRGSLPDVLDRFYQTALHYHADVIVRLTADCPLLDPELIDLTISAYLGNINLQNYLQQSRTTNNSAQNAEPFDFVANRLPPPWKRTLPIGLDVEVCSFTALRRAWKEAGEAYQREHVLPYLYEGLALPPIELSAETEWYIEQGASPRGFRVALLNHSPDYGRLRWTVDTSADLEFVRQVYAHLDDQVGFGWKKVLALLEREPELASINAHVDHKTAYEAELRNLNS
jgi:spore coat polysaccharide biosynthesis protein SpsF